MVRCWIGAGLVTLAPDLGLGDDFSFLFFCGNRTGLILHGME